MSDHLLDMLECLKRKETPSSSILEGSNLVAEWMDCECDESPTVLKEKYPYGKRNKSNSVLQCSEAGDINLEDKLSAHYIDPDFGKLPSMNESNEEKHSLFHEGVSGDEETLKRKHQDSVNIALLDDGSISRDDNILARVSKIQKTDLEHWVRVQNSFGVYYINTLSGHTSYTEPNEGEKLFEFRAKFRDKPPIGIDNLNIKDSFWVNHKQPVNISKSSDNSFPFYLTLQRECRFSKEVFSRIYIFKQLDRKLISCLAEEQGRKYVLLLDQHAAHERVCLEKLIQSHAEKDVRGFVRIRYSVLHPSLDINVPSASLETIVQLTADLNRVGLFFAIKNAATITITHVPSCFLERERSEVQRGRCSIYQQLTENLLKDSIAEYMECGRLSSTLIPKTIRNVLNSLACHGSVRFGDELSRSQCIQLIRALGQCDMPFQCAHGRPLIAPLFDINDLKKFGGEVKRRPRFDLLVQNVMNLNTIK